MTLDLSADGAALTAALVDIESVSGGEKRLAEEISLRCARCRTSPCNPMARPSWPAPPSAVRSG